MDYTERKYYFVLIDYWSYDMRTEYFKWAAPSLIIRPMNDRLRELAKSMGFQYPNAFLSCRKEDVDDLEYEMRKAERRDMCSTWEEITKDKIGQ